MMIFWGLNKQQNTNKKTNLSRGAKVEARRPANSCTENCPGSFCSSSSGTFWRTDRSGRQTPWKTFFKTGTTTTRITYDKRFTRGFRTASQRQQIGH